MMDTDRSLPSLFLPLLLLLLCSQFYVTQEQGQPPRPSNINNGFTQATALMIIILTAAIFFTGFFFLCIRSRRRAAVNTRFRTFITEMRPPNRGLDPALIGMFPTMVYSDVKGLKMSDFQLECAVCLCEFDDDDELTLLPVCDHVFHSNCIGTWLTSHSTCPVCRANLNNSLPETVAEVIPIAENPGENREVAGEETLIDKNVEARVEEDDQLRRMGSKRNISGRIISQWRSRSARPAVGRSGSRTTVGNTWDEEERERFTLRLPESVRKDLVSGTSTLRRSATVTTLLFPHIGEESSRMGYRGEGRSYILGKSARETARSGRQWGFGGDWGSGSSRGKGIADGGLLD